MKSFFNAFRNQLLFVIFLSLSAAIGYAVTVPNTFTPGTTIVSGEVNANFDALKTAVDTLEAKVSSLEANQPLPSKHGKLGYALIDSASTVTNSFNSSGGAVTVTNISTGLNNVIFSGLGDSVNADFNVQVTADFDGLIAASCQALTLLPLSADIEIAVLCINPAGTVVDVDFYILVLW